MIKETNFDKENINEILTCKMISANCNTLLNGADYSHTFSCLAYASANLIHIYDPLGIKTHFTLKGHKQRVNVVRWIDSHKNRNDLLELLSCSSDGTIIHWVNCGKEKNPFDYSSWKIEKIYTSSEPSQPVNLLYSLFISPMEKYFAAFSASGKLDLFYYDIDLNEYKMFHSVQFKKKLQDALCLTVLNNNYLLLISGGYDSLINIYTVMRINEINHHVQQKVEFSPCNYKTSLQGHVNDIRDICALCPYLDETEELYFASCSQDTYIRLWHVIPLNSNEIKSMADTINTKGSLSIFDEYKSKTSYVIKTERDEFYNIILDSVLSGHEESVSSIRWGYINNKPVILSSSFDFTVGIWKFEEKYNIWNKDVTLGEMVGNKHSFFSAIFVENFKSIIAYTYNGAFYLWRHNESDKTFSSQPIVHGHFGAVSDLDWDPSNNILISTSEDQTTRLFSYWKKNNSWHEINRPQIHGYDLNSIKFLPNDPNGSYLCKLVSGADEKVIRIFSPPFNLVKFLNNLSEVNINFNKEHDNQYYEKCKYSFHFLVYSNIEGSKQALGLMTKEVKVEANAEDEENFDFTNFNPDEMLTNKAVNTFTTKFDYSTPPDEDFLTNNTLWPESNKLFGHGYEIISVATSNDGKFIASGGKAQSEKHSKLFLWNAEKNNLICKLEGHVLTIVQIEFSRDDEYILTVSRDRSLCLFQKNNNDKEPYKLVQIEKETHGRIIWGCSWSSDSKLFITGSRDKTLKVWLKNENTNNKHFQEIICKEFQDSVTSVNIVATSFNNSLICILGFENGDLELFKIDYNTKSITEVLKIAKFLSHGSTVRRIKSFVKDNKLIFATCSDDFSTRIFEIKIDLLQI